MSNLSQPLGKQSRVYRFDRVLKTGAGQDEVFEESYVPFMVRKVVEGFHSTLFAYGQTGSGKTFTMEGYKYQANEKGIQLPVISDDSTPGLVQRCARQLFEEVHAAQQAYQRKISVNVSFMQIYNEKIYDLLNGSFFRKKGLFGSNQADPPGLKLKWNQYDVYTVENLFTYEC
jgi:hypothetical protein